MNRRKDYIEPTDQGVLKITQIRQHDDGFWIALVRLEEASAEFHDRYGSWMTNVGDGKMREAKRFVAEALAAAAYGGKKERKKKQEEAESAAAPSATGAAAPPARKNPKHRRKTTVTD